MRAPKVCLSLLLFLGLVLGLGLGVVPGALAADCGDGVAPCACGDTVVAPTTLDVTDPVTTTICPCDGLTVASGVILNLGGQTIRGSGVCVGIGVAGGANTVTVASGHILNFLTGLAALSSTDSRFVSLEVADSDSGVVIGGGGNVVEKSIVHRNAVVGIAVTGNENAVRNVEVARNGDGGGIEVTGDANVVERNTVQDNTSEGITVTGQGNAVLSNQVRGSDGHGIHFLGGTGNTAARNVVSTSARNGLEVDGVGHVVDRNRVTHNGENGMRVGGSGHAVTSNITSLNGGDPEQHHGILVEAASSHFARNRSDQNRGFGIKEVAPAGNTYDLNICNANGRGDSYPAGLCR